MPEIASGPNGFALVGRPAPTSPVWQFYSYKPDGTSLCAPLDLPADFVPASFVATPTGYLLVSSGAVRGQEVLSNCSLGLSFPIDPGPATDVNIAGGSAGYGVVWQDTTKAIPMRRLIGPHYCD